MLIESTSQYYLKKIRAKAKMYEYHIPNELHGTTEKQVNQLIISAIAIIGDFSECKFCSNGTPILKLAVHSFWFSGTRFLLKTVRFSFIIVM